MALGQRPSAYPGLIFGVCVPTAAFGLAITRPTSIKIAAPIFDLGSIESRNDGSRVTFEGRRPRRS